MKMTQTNFFFFYPLHVFFSFYFALTHFISFYALTCLHFFLSPASNYLCNVCFFLHSVIPSLPHVPLGTWSLFYVGVGALQMVSFKKALYKLSLFYYFY